MLIRSASHADRPAFQMMWEGYIEEQAQMGWQVRPGKKTMAHFMGIFESIVSGQSHGFVLMAYRNNELAGGLMWQGLEMPYDTQFGSVIVGWGIYTTPSHRKKGVAKRLIHRAINRATLENYDTYLSSYHGNNKGSQALLDGVGAVPFETSVAVPLQRGGL